jgi:adenosylcobinamide-GDP ribazoletransferase
VAAPAIGRAAPPLLARVFPPAGSGQGAAFIAGVGLRGAAAAVVGATAIAGAALGRLGLASVLIGLGAALGLGWLLSRRLGGLTGDALGAAVEVTELAVLLTTVGWTTVSAGHA